MLKIIWLFFAFLTCSKGRVRVSRWQELRKACLDRAYAGMPKKGAGA